METFKDIIASILSIALQSVVTYYYFNYFGVTWQSVIPFFITVTYLKEILKSVLKK
jgi:hypothetical protein